MSCPRRRENIHQYGDPAKDNYAGGHCSYCGSLDPDVFMARLEAQDVELGPTDKGYKVYVRNDEGLSFQQRYRKCPPDSKCDGPDECTHYVEVSIDQTKFYFQHLSEAQMVRFVELLNERKLRIGYPGYFYVSPFFIKFSEPSNVPRPTSN